jgi:type IV fimbrial biogenesis protein FimT
MTLIEIVVAVAIASMMLTAAAPAFTEYVTNSRMREGGNALLAEAIFAQSEALRRNGPVQMVVAGATIQVNDLAVPPGTNLRTRELVAGLSVDGGTVTFNGAGMPTPFPTSFSIDVGTAGGVCSSQTRCPGLRIDAGGAIRLCGNKLSCP